MSQENVEIVLDGARRFERLDGASHLWHPDSRVTAPEGWPEPGPFEGRDAVFEQFRRLAGDWGQDKISDAKVVAERADWVVLTFLWEGRGAKSGAATAMEFAGAFRVKDGQINEAHIRWTPQQALEAAGLSE
jgi:ketosteroid isomerase-like protein